MATLILGDLNINPDKLKAAEELVKHDHWTDVGKHASWWGGKDAEPTCQPRPQATPTRIDAILANKAALAWIKGFEVEQDDKIPTHKALRLKLRDCATLEPRTYAKSLPSLKKLFDIKIDGIMERKEKESEEKLTPKTKMTIRKDEKETLHENIDKYIEADREESEMYLENGDATEFWRTLSKAMEKGWLQYLDYGKEFDQGAKDRGELIEIKVTPKREKRKHEEEGNDDRGDGINAALKQARRPEQVAFRISLINCVEKEESKTKK